MAYFLKTNSFHCCTFQFSLSKKKEDTTIANVPIFVLIMQTNGSRNKEIYIPLYSAMYFVLVTHVVTYSPFLYNQINCSKSLFEIDLFN